MALSRTLDGHQGASGFAASCRLVPVFASETLQASRTLMWHLTCSVVLHMNSEAPIVSIF